MSDSTRAAGLQPTLVDERGASRAQSAPSSPMSEGRPFQRELLAGRYELLALLGTGGMGAVYRARDRELDEIVALKMLQSDLANSPPMLARFRQEVKLARRVTHPNVARTFDIGEHQGRKFLTMELVDGESLAALLARVQVMSVTQAATIGQAVCAGLHAAHAVGVVHRDLKPDNVMLAGGTRVVITDFGIACARTESPSQTLGIPVGTPEYMAPEQVEASDRIDARADIYAFGVMLFEMLTGDRPWKGDSIFAVAAARLALPPPDPRRLLTTLEDAAAAVVLRCMARRPEDRFADANELAAALGRLASDATAAPRAARAPTLAPPAMADTASKTVAVLPFRNAGSADDDYLAAGLTEELIDHLSMTRGLRVRSHAMVVRYAGTVDGLTAGRELDVQVIAEGSVRKVGDSLHVTARLISVADGFQLWAKKVERTASDVLRVGSETAQAIADALTVNLAARPLAPSDPATIDLYLRARHAYHRFWADGTGSARDLFEEALARAPSDPLILAGYAQALLRSALYDGASVADLSRTREVSERAFAVAPELAEVRVAMAAVRMSSRDELGAAIHVRRAIALAPTSPEAQLLCGRLMAEVGQPEEGMARIRTALAAEPRLYSRSEIARIAALTGDWGPADALLARPLEDGKAQHVQWSIRARLLMWRGDRARAAECAEALKNAPGKLTQWTRQLFLSIAECSLSPPTAAGLEGFVEQNRATRQLAFAHQLRAELFAYVGDDASALQAFGDSAAAGLIDIVWVDGCPCLARFRGTARFTAIRANVAERAAAVLAELSRAP